MTADRARKKATRSRMAATGEPYNTARHRTHGPELTAICGTCHEPVADNDGCIWIAKADLVAAETADREFQIKRASDWAVPLDEYPEAAEWRVDHYACADINLSAYAVEVHRCRTWPDLVNWTSHLMGKAWLAHTDWDDLLGAASEGRGSRINPANKPRLSL